MGQGGYSSRIAKLAQSLTKHGVNGADGEVTSRGLILSLREWCWREYTDILGSAEDVDTLAPSGLPPCTLARLLYQHKFVGLSRGQYFLPSSVWAASETIARSWRGRRSNARKAAVRRARLHGEPLDDQEPPAPLKALVEAGTTDLFGNPIMREQKESDHAGITGHRELVGYWCQQWPKSHHQTKYPFSPVDAKNIASLVERTETTKQAKQVIDAYFADLDRFFAGHDTNKLIRQLPRFVAAAAGGGGSAEERPYKGGDSLPVV